MKQHSGSLDQASNPGETSNPLQLTGRTFLITGAASGIGRATALLIARLGATVVCVDIDEAGLTETRQLLPAGDHRFLIRDLKNLDNIASWLSELVESIGPLHGFVHAAGISTPLPLRALSVSAWRDIFQINTEAALALIKEFHTRKIYAGANGSVVFISSVMAEVGSPATAAYSMTKSALHGMARSLAVELAPRGIRVNCVAPGFVQTPLFHRIAALQDPEYPSRMQALHPLGLGEPEDVANAVAFLLSPAARWITGTVLVVDGGYTAQ